MKVASLFAGIGGFDLALLRAGHEIIYANEWNKYAAQIYDKNFTESNREQQQNEEVGESASSVVSKSKQSIKPKIGRNNPSNDTQPIPSIKQDGKGRNRSSKQDRSDELLFRHRKSTSHRIDTRDIREVKDIPDHDLLTAGFPCQSFSIAGKRGGFTDTRGTLFFEIARIAKQKQPRLLLLENVKGLLSHDKGQTFGTILNTLDELGYDLQWQVLNSKNFGVPQNRERVFIVGHLRGTPRPQVFPLGESGKINNGKKEQRNDIAHTLTNTDKHRGSYIKQLNSPTHSNNRLYSDKGISPALNTAQGGNRQPKITKGTKIRRLTPLECERLQGFPDFWTEGLSDTQRYKCLGNAVTVNVVEAIIKQLPNL